MFGVKATGEKVDLWSSPPEFNEVSDAHKKQAKLKAEIEILEFRISEVERSIKRGSRKADVGDEAKEASKDLRGELAQVRAELAKIQSQIDFLNYWRDIFKAVSFSLK